MPLSSKLERKLRAVDESSDDESYYQVTDRSSSESLIETREGGKVISSNSEDDTSDTDDSGLLDHHAAQIQMSGVSFGALAKAQDALSDQTFSGGKRKRNQGASASHEDKLEALRERLREIKARRLAKEEKLEGKGVQQVNKKVMQSDDSEEGSDDDEQQHTPNPNSESHGSALARSSKHAPAVQSSKRMVSRKRQVVDVKKRQCRDPRFDNISGSQLKQNVVGERYAFLNDYRASEMADLRTAMVNARDEGERERLKKKLGSMESQEQTRKRKMEQQSVVREHRKNEKELIKQGKQPFYLKKSEQKRIALIDRFQNMKSKQRDKVIERRRKKATAKERKKLPSGRRAA